MPRLAVLLFAAFGLAACTNPGDLDGPPPDLGDFRLGHNVVVAPTLVRGPVSREATEEEWIAAMKSAIGERFGRHEGTRLYHFGISVEGYVLAAPGIPVIAAPKSILIFRVTVWDDAAGRKLNEKPEQFTVLETLSGDTVVGSGLTQPKEEQMLNLSRNAAKRIETWLLRRHDGQGWFGEGGGAPGPGTAEGDGARDPGPGEETEELPGAV